MRKTKKEMPLKVEEIILHRRRNIGMTESEFPEKRAEISGELLSMSVVQRGEIFIKISVGY